MPLRAFDNQPIACTLSLVLVLQSLPAFSHRTETRNTADKPGDPSLHPLPYSARLVEWHEFSTISDRLFQALHEGLADTDIGKTTTSAPQPVSGHQIETRRRSLGNTKHWKESIAEQSATSDGFSFLITHHSSNKVSQPLKTSPPRSSASRPAPTHSYASDSSPDRPALL